MVGSNGAPWDIREALADPPHLIPSFVCNTGDSNENADSIAATHNAIPALLDHVEALEKRWDGFKQWMIGMNARYESKNLYKEQEICSYFLWIMEKDLPHISAPERKEGE